MALVVGVEVIREGNEAVLEAESASNGSNALREGVRRNFSVGRGLINEIPAASCVPVSEANLILVRWLPNIIMVLEFSRRIPIPLPVPVILVRVFE